MAYKTKKTNPQITQDTKKILVSCFEEDFTLEVEHAESAIQVLQRPHSMNSIIRLEVSSLLNQFVREWETRTCLNYNITRIRLVNDTNGNPLKMKQRIPTASKA